MDLGAHRMRSSFVRPLRVDYIIRSDPIHRQISYKQPLEFHGPATRNWCASCINRFDDHDKSCCEANCREKNSLGSVPGSIGDLARMIAD
jgi:hypothetical protein